MLYLHFLLTNIILLKNNYMKKLFICILLNIVFINIFSLETGSVIKEVIVYQNGARIVHEVNTTVPAGNSEVVITDLTSYLQQNTIQLDVEGNAIILSASSRLNYITPRETSARVKSLQDSLNIIENQLKTLSGEKQVYAGEEKLINENNKLGSQQTGVEVTQLKMLADFYRTRLLEIKKQLVAIEEKEKQLQVQKNRIQDQLEEINSIENQPKTEVVVNVSANVASKVKIMLSYLVNSAGWSPVYDIRSEDTDKPVKLIYKANVYQTTGYDWNNIRLSVSTRDPRKDQDRPVLNPWFVDFYQPIPYAGEEFRMKSAAPAASNIYADDLDAKEEISESVAPEYVVNETSGLLSTEYAIENIQDIPSDGKEHLVAMREYEVISEYTYHAVPKLSDGVFLLAKMADFGSLNLIPGNANLFNGGLYVGQTYIDPFTTSDTLLVSLGRDENISIKRNILKDLTSKQVIGNNKKETKGFEIIVKNNKSIPVELEVMDNIPISKNNEIEVALIQGNGAEFSKDYGRLLWKLQLKPGESKKINFSFSVKYPKDKVITGI